MLKYVIPFLVLAGLAGPAAQAADTIGFRQIAVPDAGGTRPLDVTIWYPSEAGGSQTVVGENPAFAGISVVKDAAPSGGRHPLVVLSHGFGGSWRNLNWLAGDLVQQGYVVAAADHPGTTAFDKRPAEAARLWERPRDMSRVIDALTHDPSFGISIDTTRIAAIGHSLGGWTVVAAAGARFDADRLDEECKSHSDLRACEVFITLGIGADLRPKLGGDLKDERIAAIVSLDLGLARGFTPANLAAIHIPTLIVAAGTNVAAIPAKLESGYLAQNLPAATSRYVEIADATHFSFMGICKPGAIALIEEETPGDGIVCKDGGARDRIAIHRQVADLIIGFLAEALPQRR
jgi:predicted dienelactone hydrolase